MIPQSQKRVLRIVLIAVVSVLALRLQSMLPGDLKSTCVTALSTLAVAVLGNEITKLLDDLERKETSATPRESGFLAWISWPTSTAFVLLVIPGFVAQCLSQLFLDSVDSTLLSLQAAHSLMITDEGSRRLLLTIMGMIVFTFFVPVICYIAVSVGIRMRKPLRYRFLLATSVVAYASSSMANIVSEAFTGSRGAPGQPVWFRVVQLVALILFLALVQWACVRTGFWLRKRRLA